jgi:hypothetical protein
MISEHNHLWCNTAYFHGKYIHTAFSDQLEKNAQFQLKSPEMGFLQSQFLWHKANLKAGSYFVNWTI